VTNETDLAFPVAENYALHPEGSAEGSGRGSH